MPEALMTPNKNSRRSYMVLQLHDWNCAVTVQYARRVYVSGSFQRSASYVAGTQCRNSVAV